MTFKTRTVNEFEFFSVEVEKINQGHIINNQPLPSEFLRDRKPYSQAHVETKPHTPEHQPRAQAQPQTQTPTPPKPTPRSNSTYRVDHLPESLWDEALTVAAQTYAFHSHPYVIDGFTFCIAVSGTTLPRLPLKTWPTLSFRYVLSYLNLEMTNILTNLLVSGRDTWST